MRAAFIHICDCMHRFLNYKLLFVYFIFLYSLAFINDVHSKFSGFTGLYSLAFINDKMEDSRKLTNYKQYLHLGVYTRPHHLPNKSLNIGSANRSIYARSRHSRYNLKRVSGYAIFFWFFWNFVHITIPFYRNLSIFLYPLSMCSTIQTLQAQTVRL